jgi:hypothetical protein
MAWFLSTLGLHDGSGTGGGHDQRTPMEFVNELKEACMEGKGDPKKFRDLWKSVEKRRGPDNDFDEAVIKTPNDAMKWIKFAFRHRDSQWREEGIEVAYSFFHSDVARDKLANNDFIHSLLLATLPDDQGEDEEDENTGEQKKREEKQSEMQKRATEILLDMADHPEFLEPLCATDVLNSMCIALNQVPGAVENVTHTFVKLSMDEKNLAILMEGGVGDILESFFKTVKYKRPPEEEDAVFEQWTHDINALSYCAHTLGTFVKHGHRCQVHLPTTIGIFREANLQLANRRNEIPDNVHLLAEMARLFYWVCRKSDDVTHTLLQASSDLDGVLSQIKDLWNRCVATQEMVDRNKVSSISSDQDFKYFMVDDLIFSKKLNLNTKENQLARVLKIERAQRRLCYLNCTLWVLLPHRGLRWRMKRLGLAQLHLGFQLSDEDFEFKRVILSAVRDLVDMPKAQECAEFIRFFGEKLLVLLRDALANKLPPQVLRVFLDALNILSMQREMQELLRQNDIYTNLSRITINTANSVDAKKIELAVLRTVAEVAMHPSHRLTWVGQSVVPYPPREKFKPELEKRIREPDENIKTISSLLLTVFEESKFMKPASEIETTFKSILDWWLVNSTARYEEEVEAANAVESGIPRANAELVTQKPLAELLARAIALKKQQRALTIMDTVRYCAPHECILALSLFSRLALEPKFKRFFTPDVVHALLGCVCVGIWAEAREAAASLANLLWLPDQNEENLVCWLKFDGPKCIAVDAANVLMPVRDGNPRPADIGKGMYKSTWGVQFVEGACVTLHPDGLKTHKLPGLLTSASPSDTFASTSQRSYERLERESDADQAEKHFTISCWLYWPLITTKGQCVLVQSTSRRSQIFLDLNAEDDGSGQAAVWNLDVDHYTAGPLGGSTERKRCPLKTPQLSPGWHMLTLVSSTRSNQANPFDGTKFFLDEWHCVLNNAWVENDFYIVGNDQGGDGKKPFGLMCDFRIYARSLPDKKIEDMVRKKDTEDHPDKIARMLASMNAATILAQRLDVPDSAAECLRALGSLATLQSQRAKIFSVCGREVLSMLDSPLPMIQRQAARLVNNIT